MEISRLHVEAISAATKPRNQMPLPLSPGAPIFLGSDVTTFLHKYESIAAFTATDPSSRNVVVMLPYYCTEAIRETVMMMRGYERRDWAALKKEMMDAFRYTDSRPDSLVYTRQYLENLCAEFGGREDTESLKSFLRTYDHISGVVTERGMMVEYERTEMLRRAPVLSTVPSDHRPRPSVRNIGGTDGTAPRPSVPSLPAEDGMSADDGRGRQKYRHRPSSTVTGRHRAVTINTYIETVECAIQDINRFIYVSRLSISSKHSGSDGADVKGSCFTVKIVEKCTYYN